MGATAHIVGTAMTAMNRRDRTADDMAVDLPWTAQQFGRGAHLAGRNKLADGGRRIDCAVTGADR